jgi:hypothetical protein
VNWKKFKFQPSPGSILFLQSNGEWYGNHSSTALLSCNITEEEATDRMKKLGRFLERSRKDVPVRWSDVLDRKLLFDESYDDEQAGDLIRDGCNELKSIDFSGGYLFGGSDGMKFTRKPSIEKREKGQGQLQRKKPVIVVNCRFSGKHRCDILHAIDTTGRLKDLQETVSNLALLGELKTWRDKKSSKARKLLKEVEKLID